MSVTDVVSVTDAANRAADSLERIRMHIKAGLFEPTAEQTIELFQLVCGLVLAKQAGGGELMDAIAKVDEFTRMVCPAAMGGVN